MKKKLKIAFISPKRYSFYPPDYENRGLGGTESMLVLLTKALVRRGHEVYVYNCCFKPGIYDGVKWKSLWSFSDNNFDVVISLRLLETFTEFNIKSKLRGVWIHDDSLHGASKLDSDNIVNLWISVSETQKELIEKSEVIKKDNWFVTRNAYDKDLYSSFEIKKKLGQLIYCSAPDRGLKYILKYWKDIKDNNPMASLHVTGSFALWGNSDEENNRFFTDLYKLESELKDVYFYKRLSKKELVKLQTESQLMVYPTIFDEMYCISALECMAVKTPVISSSRAAMIERIKNDVDGYLIEGKPESSEYQKQFVSKVTDLLHSQEKLEKIAEKAQEKVLQFDFDNLAQEWEVELFRRLNSFK
jgi:glycosyltransferase involved in cell wall biosynthesis